MLRPLKLISSTNVNFDLGHLPGQICDQISLNGLTQLFSCIFFSFLKSLALQKRHSLHRLQAVDIADSAIWRRKATMSICARRTPAIITRLSPPLSQGHLLPKRFKLRHYYRLQDHASFLSACNAAALFYSKTEVVLPDAR